MALLFSFISFATDEFYDESERRGVVLGGISGLRKNHIPRASLNSRQTEFL
jgi:hypothetical protein